MDRSCQKCGAPLTEGQDWCLQCGTAAPGSLQTGRPGWRSATAVLGVTAVLVLGAGAAAYAALTQPSTKKPAPKVITVAQAPTTPATTIPTTPGTTATTPAPTTTPGLGTPTTVKPLTGTTKPPKIPLTAPAPKSSNTTPSSSKPGAGKSKTETGETGNEGKTNGEGAGESETPGGKEPTPILLDTDAASTYNPYNLPASNFGDPSLAIDGETSTGWSAQVEPSTAPRMAVGLAIDLRTPQRVASITLVTSTPGMTVQMYGSKAKTLPSSITDPEWTTLSHSLDAKKHHTHVKLRHSKEAFRFIALWISAAPKSAVGTPSAPGHVSINELELFPAK